MFTIAIFVFPCYGFYIIICNFKKLDKKETKDKVGIFIDNIKLDNKHRVMFNVYFLCRKLLTVLVLVFMDDFPFFQMVILMLLGTLNLIYLITEKPLVFSMENKVETLNEMAVVISSHIMTLFLNTANPQELQDLLGWVIIGLACLVIVINMSVTVISSFSQSYAVCLTKRNRNKARKVIDKMFASRKKLLKMIPNEFKNFEHEQELVETIHKIKKWLI